MANAELWLTGTAIFEGPLAARTLEFGLSSRAAFSLESACLVPGHLAKQGWIFFTNSGHVLG